jgi:hypothetical protein
MIRMLKIKHRLVIIKIQENGYLKSKRIKTK